MGTLEAQTSDAVAPGSIDLIVSSMVFEHVPQPRAALSKWISLLRPGGLIFIEVPNENPVPNWWGRDEANPYWVGHLSFFSLKHLVAMVESLGLEVLGNDNFDHPVSPGYVMQSDPVNYSLPESTSADTEHGTSAFP
ncbi:unnamed protein product, partial [Polarella glacialis]